MSAFKHTSVLLAETIAGLEIVSGDRYLDATLGGGGHARAILETAPGVHLTAIDRDAMALEAAGARLAEFGECVEFWRGNFADFEAPSATYGGVLADLGVSSPQFDAPERGFSFQHEAALDMRMDDRQALTAAEIVNHWDERELADLIYEYGEERLSRRIARHLVGSRPFQTTTALAAAIAACVPGKYRHGRIHPATRTFQALRIAVNAELTSLEAFLPKATQWLRPGGVLAIISFHSLEDRRVKYHIRDSPDLKAIVKKPIVAGLEECRQNPRARSAKLRLARRVLPQG
ncbi:MAG: 16S rRNA (cytosine(1402)-N(4))-methyltransferase RsmH [Cyanobacteria bacterium J06641_5]